MQRIAVSARLEGTAAQPSGEPPQTDPRAASVAVEASSSDGSPFPVTRVSYANHVTYTGQTTFSESGTITYDDAGDEVDIVTVGDGTLGPSADPDILHGAVVYRITGGRGRLAGASGLITSNFLLRPANGTFEEQQITVMFLP